MATVLISWHKGGAFGADGATARQALDLVQQPALADPPTSVTTNTTTATSSAAAPANTDIAAVFSDTAHYYAVNAPGGTRVAGTGHLRIPANTEFYIHMRPGYFLSLREVA